jgi:Fe-S-cluster-containing hydrogenase component 2
MKKKVAIKDKNDCMACRSCELACSEAFYKKSDPGLSCIQIESKDDKIKIAACVQCGKCAKACESEAITQNSKGVYILNKKKCTNCGKCVEACPFKVLIKAEDAPFPSKCIACGICVKACPMEILYLKEEAS